MDISIVVPVYNSEKSLSKLYERLTPILESGFSNYEIIFVDDFSHDNSWEKIKELSIKNANIIGVQLMKNSGQGKATLAGIDIATGEYIVTMDDDLQHPPEDIMLLYNALIQDEQCDIVIGMPKEKKHNIVRKIGSTLVNNINNIILKKDSNLRFTGFRIFRLNVAKELIKLKVPYPALGPMCYSITHRIKNVAFNHNEREYGRSNYTLSKIIKQFFSNLIGFSMFPLRFMAVAGGVGTVISIMIGIFFLVRYFSSGVNVAGWTSLLLVQLSISGFMFFAMGLMGEYLLKIMIMSSEIPKYSIRKKIGKSI